MNILYTALHKIDHKADTITEIDFDSQGEDLKVYTQNLIVEITESSTKRQFEFKSNTTEVRNSINKFLKKEYKDAASINAERLKNIEIDAQSRIDHLNKEIQKGSLFQSIIEDKNEMVIIISKADHNPFLDESDFTKKNGLPWENTTFKAFLVRFNSKQIQKELFVYDKTNRMARYWWDNYLELREKYTDTFNTKKSLEILDRKIFNPIKQQYPRDHTILRNSTLRYYRSSNEFKLDDFISQTFENYKPVDQSFPNDEIIKKIKNLPDKWGFDTTFSIISNEISKRSVNTIYLADNVDLVLKDYIDDMDDLILTDIDSEGTKYIKIKSENGYNHFKR